jgi:hypothetical protein
VVEQGTAADLLAQGGRFAALWHTQMDGADPAGPPAGDVAGPAAGGNGQRSPSPEGAGRA